MGRNDHPVRPRRSVVVTLACIGAVTVAALLAWYLGLFGARPDSLAPDPRLSYHGPFKNVHPDVAYVNDAACAECHPRHAETFGQHPMARTLMPIDQVGPLPLDAAAHHPFEALGQQFQVSHRGGRTSHARTAVDPDGRPLFAHELEVQLAIGSGTHGHSFLSVRGTTVWQSPISWFTHAKRWDLSPGFTPDVLVGRRVGGECLFCHSNGTNEDPEDDMALRAPIFPKGHGIGCQRCHGPGGEHVKNPGIVATTAGELDPTIVNPAHLASHLRESVCWQCHLEGHVRVLRRGRQRYDYRPGMPLEDFEAIFVDEAETNFDAVVNHVEQMMQSRCYRQSAGPKQMGCVSCHDPHEKPPPDERVRHFRAACLKCHGDDACSLPRPARLAQHKDDSCVACHMRSLPTSDIVHASITDHRIPRRAAPRVPTGRMAEVQNLMPVFESQRDKDDLELARDRAVASAVLVVRGRTVRDPLYRELEAAFRRHPSDLVSKRHFAIALIERHDEAGALPLIEEIRARQPNNEQAILAHAIACSRLGRVKEALDSWHHLIQIDPLRGAYRRPLLDLLVLEQLWDQAVREAQSWVAIDPGLPEAHAILRDIFVTLGRTDEANEQNRIFRGLARR
jgi:hypothetical protein